MRLRDAYQFPSRRFQLAFQTERALLKSFELSEPSKEDEAFLARVLDPVLSFMSEADCNAALPDNVAALLLRIRSAVRERDQGVMRYSLERALGGELEICSARLLISVLGRLHRILSMNAGAFHLDEHLQPEDEFREPFSAWKVEAGVLVLAMSDLRDRGNRSQNAADALVFSGLTGDEINRVLEAIDFVPG
jgi:hypothetical protein